MKLEGLKLKAIKNVMSNRGQISVCTHGSFKIDNSGCGQGHIYNHRGLKTVWESHVFQWREIL